MSINLNKSATDFMQSWVRKKSSGIVERLFQGIAVPVVSDHSVNIGLHNKRSIFPLRSYCIYIYSKFMQKKQRKRTEIDQLVSMTESEIDTSDIPETTDWEKAVMGKFYRPVKKQVSLRLNTDMTESNRAGKKSVES